MTDPTPMPGATGDRRRGPGTEVSEPPPPPTPRTALLSHREVQWAGTSKYAYVCGDQPRSGRIPRLHRRRAGGHKKFPVVATAQWNDRTVCGRPPPAPWFGLREEGKRSKPPPRPRTNQAPTPPLPPRGEVRTRGRPPTTRTCRRRSKALPRLLSLAES